MTVKELVEILAGFDQEAEVAIEDAGCGCCSEGFVLLGQPQVTRVFRRNDGSLSKSWQMASENERFEVVEMIGTDNL